MGFLSITSEIPAPSQDRGLKLDRRYMAGQSREHKTINLSTTNASS